MKRATIGMGAVVVGFAMLTLSAAPGSAADRSGFEMYVVRSGDTLSRISARAFGDAKRWREILKENPQITNANRIYPGDTLFVPVAVAAAAAGGELMANAQIDALPVEIVPAPAAAGDQEAGAAAAPAETAAAAPEQPAEPVRPVATVSPALYRAAGSIASSLPGIAIIASQDDRILLVTDDAAVVNAPLKPGTRFTVVRADRRIYHPLTGEYLGWLIRILGSAEVTCRGERTSTVALRSMSDAAGIGDYLVPFDPDDVLGKSELAAKSQPECLPAGASDGVIVAFNEERLTVGEQDLVYIDRGTAAGVAPGQRFTIYRELAPERRVTVGELQVLRAGERTATALVTASNQEVLVGYLLRAR